MRFPLLMLYDQMASRFYMYTRCWLQLNTAHSKLPLADID